MYLSIKTKQLILSQKESVKHLWNDWADLLNNDHEEEKLNSDWPVFTTHVKTRCLLWDLCRGLVIKEKEVAAYAARLLDRYLSAHVNDLFVNHRSCKDQDYLVKWQQFHELLNENILVIILSCIRISLKLLMSRSSPWNSLLSAKVLARVLEAITEDSKIDIEKPDKTINETEVKILFTLGGRMPLWTSLQITMYISEAVKLKEKCEVLLDYCEMNRADIENKVRTAAGLRPQDQGSLRTLPLCAGVVLTLSLKGLNLPNCAVDIGRVTKLPVRLIECVCHAVLEVIAEKCFKVVDD